MATTVEFQTGSITETKALSLSGGNLFIAFRDQDADNQGQFTVYNSSGTQIVTPTAFNTGQTDNIDCDELSNGNIVVTFRDITNTNKGTFVVVNAAGTVVVAETVFHDGSTLYTSVVGMATGNFMVCYADSGASNHGQLVTFTNAGAAVVTETEFLTATTTHIQSCLLANGNVLIAYANSTTNGQFQIYSPAGVSVVGATTFDATRVRIYCKPVVLASTNVVIVYEDFGDTYKGKFHTYTQAGVEAVTTTTFHSGYTFDHGAAELTTGNVIFTYRDESNDAKYVVYTAAGVLAIAEGTIDSGTGYYTSVAVFTDGRVGVSYADVDSDGQLWLDIVFLPPADRATTKRFVTISNNEVWYGTTPEDLAELTTTGNTIDTSDQLSIFEAYGKVFFVNGTKLKVADFQNTKITTDDISPTTYHAPDRGNILTETDGAQMVVDYITALNGTCTIYGYRITAAKFQNAHAVTGHDDDGNDIQFTLNADETAPPHWYNWTVYANDTTSYGTMPSTAYVGCLSGGRCILSGNPDYPHQAPGSAAGNPWDWNIYRTTADRATVIGSGSAGQIGDVVRALIPARDGQLIVGCANTMHIMIDNPAYGGQMVDINGTGIFDATSWCFDGDGNLYFWGTGGIYRLAKGAAQVECITALSLPTLITDTGADPSTHRITMGFDAVRQGIKVCITLLADGSNSNYWYDLQTQGFFPDTHADDHGVYSIFQYDANDPDYKDLLLGCTDGYIRVHDDDTKNDDSTAIDSYVTFGPIPLAEDGRDGSIEAFDLILSGGATGTCDDATLEVWTEDVAETVIEDLNAGTSPQLAITFTGPGRAHGAKRRRGVRGAYAGIKIGNDTVSKTWGMEKLLIDAGALGRRLR